MNEFDKIRLLHGIAAALFVIAVTLSVIVHSLFLLAAIFFMIVGGNLEIKLRKLQPK